MVTQTSIQIVALSTPLKVAHSLVHPQVTQQTEVELRTRVASEGKWSKLQVYYFPVTLIPPAAYFYECSICRFFKFDQRSCDLVQGLIEPYAWCAVWLPMAEDKPWSWIGRAIKP